MSGVAWRLSAPLGKGSVRPCHVQHLRTIPQWWAWGVPQPTARPAAKVPAPSLPAARTFASPELVQAPHPGGLPYERSLRSYVPAPPASYLHNSLPTTGWCPVPRTVPVSSVSTEDARRSPGGREQSGDVSDCSTLYSRRSVRWWPPHVQPAPWTTKHHLQWRQWATQSRYEHGSSHSSAEYVPGASLPHGHTTASAKHQSVSSVHEPRTSSGCSTSTFPAAAATTTAAVNVQSTAATWSSGQQCLVWSSTLHYPAASDSVIPPGATSSSLTAPARFPGEQHAQQSEE